MPWPPGPPTTADQAALVQDALAAVAAAWASGLPPDLIRAGLAGYPAGVELARPLPAGAPHQPAV